MHLLATPGLSPGARGQKLDKCTKWNVNKNKNVQRETYKYENRSRKLSIHKIRGPEEDNMNNGRE